MSEWREVQLQDLVSRLGDGLHGTPKYSDDGKYYFINGNNLTDGHIVVDEKTRRVSEVEYQKHKRELTDRTILVSINGTLGNIAYYNGENVILGKSACYFNVNNTVDKNFIRYVLTDRNFQHYIETFATGTTIKNLSLKSIREFSFRLPPLPEQRRIAAILSSLDAQIDLLRRQNATLEALAQTLFTRWFVDFDFPDAQGRPYRSAGGPMQPSALGEIPAGWRVGTLGEATDISIGRTPPRKETQWFSLDPKDVKWISIKDMGNCGVFIDDTSEYLTREAVKRFNVPKIPTNTVILSFKLTVGRVTITTEEMLSNEAIAHLKTQDDMLTPEYLFLFFKGFNFSHLGSTSSIATAVNSKTIKEIELTIPNIAVLNNFSDRVVPLFNKLRSNTHQIHTLTRLRDALLPKLMSGELRVPAITPA